jgi:nucleolar complex protein 3
MLSAAIGASTLQQLTLLHFLAISDLMDVLKDLLKESHNLPLEAAIHCILCALKTLRGPGREAIPVDPKEYLIPLYNELSRLGIYDYQSNLDSSSFMEYTEHSSSSGSGSNMEKSVSAAIQCLDHAFTKRRELSASRLCAFLKRIASTTLHCPPHTSAPLIASARQLSLRYASIPKVTNMLENEQDIVYSEGTFVPEATDPEHSNAHATSLWELSLLKFNVNPTVADHASNMAEGKFLKLPGESPSNIGEVMGRNAKEGYIMHKAVVKKHPLHQAATVDGDSKNNERKKSRQRMRNQNQVRFITPRKTGNWHLPEASSVSML